MLDVVLDRHLVHTDPHGGSLIFPADPALVLDLLSNKSNLSSLQFENLFKSIFFLLFFPPFLLIKVNDFEQMCLVVFQ